ncbi:MAG: hypothetical protein UT85_C0038G0012 [Candidatus Levybacteria bacterium GW2011_GWA2_40_16]|nr:MAG: hypothetical protein UT85_C0038G0012 [Candidatus Levybacteria bacterium GW2011_GWA2_40_16]
MRREVLKYLILRTVGNFLVLFTIFAFIATFGPALYYEASWRVSRARGISYSLADDVASQETELGKLARKYQDQEQTKPSSPSLLRDVLSNSKEQVLIPGNCPCKRHGVPGNKRYNLSFCPLGRQFLECGAL